MTLYQDPWFTFRFAEARRITRFHLEGIAVGRSVAVFRIDSETLERREYLAEATVGEEGWVEVVEPIVVAAGDAFIAIPQ